MKSTRPKATRKRDRRKRARRKQPPPQPHKFGHFVIPPNARITDWRSYPVFLDWDFL